MNLNTRMDPGEVMVGRDAYDVVVVGGRCGGAALARLTARAGLRTLVVDRATFPSDVVSTHAISSHGTTLLQRWGLFDAVVATGAPHGRAMRLQAGGVDVVVPVPDDRPGSLAPRRTVLDPL